MNNISKLIGDNDEHRNLILQLLNISKPELNGFEDGSLNPNFREALLIAAYFDVDFHYVVGFVSKPGTFTEKIDFVIDKMYEQLNLHPLEDLLKIKDMVDLMILNRRKNQVDVFDKTNIIINRIRNWNKTKLIELREAIDFIIETKFTSGDNEQVIKNKIDEIIKSK